MSSIDTTAGQIMDAAASLNNDTAKTIYPYSIQLPYLNMALKELQEYFELNNAPVTNKVSAVISIPQGATSLTFNSTPPSLPSDLVEIQQLWERDNDSSGWIPLSRVDFLDHILGDDLVSSFSVWAWSNNAIQFHPSNRINYLKIDYIKSLFVLLTDEEDEIGVVNSESFLQYRTAGLLAEFVGEDPNRAQSMNQFASLALDRSIGINTKGMQAHTVRRRPFRASYKSRYS